MELLHACGEVTQDLSMKAICDNATITMRVCALDVAAVFLNGLLPAFAYATKKCIAFRICSDRTVCIMSVSVNVYVCLAMQFLSLLSFSFFLFPAASILASTVGLSM